MWNQKWVVLNDLQIPFHDRRVLERLVIPFINTIEPDGVILNGDIVDFYALSRFDKRPSLRDIKKEMSVVKSYINDLSHRNRQIVWLGGNHEDRLRVYLWKRIPEIDLHPDTVMVDLFDLRDVVYHPYPSIYPLGHLDVTHGHLVRKHSSYSARAFFDVHGQSAMIGHTHRLGSYYRTTKSGTHVVYENGCLCRFDLDYLKARPDWQQGFSVVHLFKKGQFNVQQIPIIDRRYFMYGGQLYHI